MENQAKICYNVKIYKAKTTMFARKQKQKVLFGLIFALFFVMPTMVFAQRTGLPLPDSSNYGDIIAPDAGQTGEEQAVSLVEGVVKNVKIIIGTVAIAIIILLAIRILLTQGNEEEAKKLTKGVLWVIIGLALISLSFDIAQILGPQDGGIIKDSNTILRRVQLFDYKVDIVITFIKYILGSIAVAFILRNGMRLITISSDEENVTQDKKNLAASAVGLVLIYLSDILINKVLYRVDTSYYPTTGGVQPAFNAGAGINELIGFTNFAVYLTAPLAIAVLVAGGIMYITAAGDDDRTGRAKRMIISSVIGLVIIYGSFAIVNTFIPEQVTVQAVPAQ
jgi:hypothetical protein